MLSSVFLSGRLGPLSESNVRLVEVDRVIPEQGGRYGVFSFPVRCPLSKGSCFFTAKPGSSIVLKGRLEMDKEIGLLIVSEVEEINPIS